MKETQNIEFKRQWRDDFLAELCGFANAQGGTLFESEQLQFPTFEQVRGGMLATIQRERFVAIISGTSQSSDQETGSDTETTQKNIVENIVEKLSAKQVHSVRLMIAKPTISAKEIAKELSIAPRNVQVHIKKLQEQCFIHRIGPDKGGHWEAIEKP